MFWVLCAVGGGVMVDHGIYWFFHDLIGPNTTAATIVIVAVGAYVWVITRIVR